MKKLIRFALPAMLAFGAQWHVAAFAQDKAQPAPTDAAAPAAPVAYDSAFAGYRSDKDTPAVGWKESNERVAQPHDEHAGHDMGSMAHGQHGQHGQHGKAAMAHGQHGQHGKPAPAAAPAPADQAAEPAKADKPHHSHQHKE